MKILSFFLTVGIELITRSLTLLMNSFNEVLEEFMKRNLFYPLQLLLYLWKMAVHLIISHLCAEKRLRSMAIMACMPIIPCIIGYFILLSSFFFFFYSFFINSIAIAYNSYFLIYIAVFVASVFAMIL